MTVAELLERISSAELAEWAAYERVAGPVGPVRGDLHAATVAATTANAGRGKKGRKARVRDFMPNWGRPAQTPEGVWAAIVAANAQLGGAVDGDQPEGD